MSFYEYLPGFQFTDDDLNSINNAYDELSQNIPTDKINEWNQLGDFLRSQESQLGFREIFLDLAYSSKPVIMIDALNVSHYRNFDILGNYDFLYAERNNIPQLIRENFNNYPARSRSPTESELLREPELNGIFTLENQIQFLKNTIVLLTNDNRLNYNFVLVFKIRNEKVVKEGLYRSRFNYIYMLFILEKSSIGSEIDDIACVYLSYLFESKYGIPTGILSADNYNWANDDDYLRKFIDTHKVIFPIYYSGRNIINTPTIVNAGRGFTSSIFKLSSQ